MNLHEYQTNNCSKFNVPVQEGIACNTHWKRKKPTARYTHNTAAKFAVVKAQIHAGGRGKGKIAGTEQRGVAVGKSAEDIKQIAQNILGGTLVTLQTGLPVKW